MRVGWNFKQLVINAENIARQAAPDDFSPYNARINLHGLP
jgi:hypothetical protein